MINMRRRVDMINMKDGSTCERVDMINMRERVDMINMKEGST